MKYYAVIIKNLNSTNELEWICHETQLSKVKNDVKYVPNIIQFLQHTMTKKNMGFEHMDMSMYVHMDMQSWESTKYV